MLQIIRCSFGVDGEAFIPTYKTRADGAKEHSTVVDMWLETDLTQTYIIRWRQHYV